MITLLYVGCALIRGCYVWNAFGEHVDTWVPPDPGFMALPDPSARPIKTRRTLAAKMKRARP